MCGMRDSEVSEASCRGGRGQLTAECTPEPEAGGAACRWCWCLVDGGTARVHPHSKLRVCMLVFCVCVCLRLELCVYLIGIGYSKVLLKLHVDVVECSKCKLIY